MLRVELSSCEMVIFKHPTYFSSILAFTPKKKNGMCHMIVFPYTHFDAFWIRIDD